jgi:hypothetical protein
MNADALAWVDRAVAESGLGRAGVLEPVKIRPWASVWRTSTSGDDVYFKQNAPGGRHEPVLTAQLAEAWPGLVPAPLAVDPERGWLLTLDHGQRMSDALEPAPLLAELETLLPRYAELQIASSRDPKRWLALGVPDRRLDRIPALADRLLRDDADLDDNERARMLSLLPELDACCAELASVPCATALEHGDLHGANILVGRSGTWIFDWADASVSHPFVTLLVTCSTVVGELDAPAGRRTCARLVDAYLEPFTRLAPIAALRGLVSSAAWVGHVSRALDWEHMLAGANAAGRAEWESRLPAWLRAWERRRAWRQPGFWP